jgi:hypothetical protein
MEKPTLSVNLLKLFQIFIVAPAILVQFSIYA